MSLRPTLARRVTTLRSLYGLLVTELELQRAQVRDLRDILERRDHDADRELEELMAAVSEEAERMRGVA